MKTEADGESTDEELALPDVQPDRAWAEHLGMPRLIADLRAARAEVERLRSEWAAIETDDRYRHSKDFDF